MGRNKDIRDDEIRIIGAPNKAHASKVWIKAAIAITCTILVGVLLFAFWPRRTNEAAVPVVVFEPENEVVIEQEEPVKWLGDYSESIKAYTEHLRDTINDIPLDIYIPHNAVPELMVGVPDIFDKTYERAQ